MRSDRTQRWTTIVLGVAVVALSVWIVAHDFHPPEPIGHPVADGGGVEGGALARVSAEAGESSEDAGLLFLSDLLAPAPRSDAGTGATLPDGSPVPPLPATAPRQVRFGVVLVSYAGAQPGATGTRPVNRSKADAMSLADKLAAAAVQDFRAAVQQGDPGATDDVGQLKAGILEPAPEYVLFTLSVGAVGGPVDTPRGYWIVKRLE